MGKALRLSTGYPKNICKYMQMHNTYIFYITNRITFKQYLTQTFNKS